MIINRIDRLKQEIAECVLACNRRLDEVKLLAVTKTHSVDIIKNALCNGIEFIAESKVQEAEQKIPQLDGLYKEFHFIGHLQSNKINKLLCMKPVLIHSIDKFSTAEKLNQALKLINQEQDILIEVNASGEDSKNGVDPKNLSEILKQIDDLEYINIKGLMTIGAFTADERIVRKSFIYLRELFEKEKGKNYSSAQMVYLSMGMSSDFKIAIEEGAHILRLGSVLFGERNYTKNGG